MTETQTSEREERVWTIAICSDDACNKKSVLGIRPIGFDQRRCTRCGAIPKEVEVVPATALSHERQLREEAETVLGELVKWSRRPLDPGDDPDLKELGRVISRARSLLPTSSNTSETE